MDNSYKKKKEKEILKALYEARDNILKDKVSMLDVCPKCHVDDFVHVEGCKHVDLFQRFMDLIDETEKQAYEKGYIDGQIKH